MFPCRRRRLLARRRSSVQGWCCHCSVRHWPAAARVVQQRLLTTCAMYSDRFQAETHGSRLYSRFLLLVSLKLVPLATLAPIRLQRQEGGLPRSWHGSPAGNPAFATTRRRPTPSASRAFGLRIRHRCALPERWQLRFTAIEHIRARREGFTLALSLQREQHKKAIKKDHSRRRASRKINTPVDAKNKSMAAQAAAADALPSYADVSPPGGRRNPVARPSTTCSPKNTCYDPPHRTRLPQQCRRRPPV